jgi:hypothetical protein
VGLTYAHTYDSPSRRNGVINLFDNTGSQLAAAPFGNVPTSANNYGLELSFRPTSKLIVFGWGATVEQTQNELPVDLPLPRIPTELF